MDINNQTPEEYADELIKSLKSVKGAKFFVQEMIDNFQLTWWKEVLKALELK